MQLTDLTGLSKPLERLIEELSKGVGTLTKPYFIKKEANAEAQKIHTLSKAITEATGQKDLMVTYNAGEIGIWPNQKDRTYNPATTTLEERAKIRLDYQERKKQHNLENITSTAAIELMNETEIPEESPDEDWINRFFEYAPNVSTEHMQDLWGRILAGEIKRPGTFSLRTLDFLKNITKEEAELFEKIAKLAVKYIPCLDLIRISDKDWLDVNYRLPYYHFTTRIAVDWLEEKYDIRYDHYVILGELGILAQGFIDQHIFGHNVISEQFILSRGDSLLIKRNKINDSGSITTWKFTNVGSELLSLSNQTPDTEYLEKIGQFFMSSGAEASIVKIKGRLPGGSYDYESINRITA